MNCLRKGRYKKPCDVWNAFQLQNRFGDRPTLSDVSGRAEQAPSQAFGGN
jgi:hypothetical protein